MSLKVWLRDRWGWVVVWANFWTFFTGFSVLYCYGLLYLALQEEFKSGNAETAWIGSICVGVTSVGTIISPRLVQRFGNKPVAFIGLTLLVSGCMLTSYMPSIEPIYLTFGVIVGIGNNLVYISGYLLILSYFPDENAPRATSLALTGTTSGMMALNPLVYYLITHWGWRIMLRVMGTMILVIGIPCICTFIQPPNNPLNSSEKQSETTKDVQEKERRLSRRQSQAGVMFDKKPMSEQLRVLLFPELWFFALATLGSAMVQSFYIVSFVAFVTTNGFEKKDGAMIMTVIAVANIFGKLLLSGIGDNYPFPKILLFDIASTMGISVMVTLLVAKQLWVLYCLAIVTGMLMSVFDCVIMSVGLEVFGPENTIQTSSILLASLGVGCVLGSLFGMSVDSSGSYDAAIYACIGIYVAAIVLYTAVPIYQKLFAKERYLMGNYKEKQRVMKEDARNLEEKEKRLQENDNTISTDRTFDSPPCYKPVHVEKVTTV